MATSVIQEQKDAITNTLRNITRGDWMVLVVDEASKTIIDNVTKEDDILDQKISNIERIEERREPNPGMDAIYLLSPEPHIVDCLVADFEQRRYRSAFLIWTSLLDNSLRRRLESSPGAKQMIAGFDTMAIDFFPRESHLVTFRDPWSFPVLFHPSCNNLVRPHMEILAQKIMSVCVTMGEYPKVRYYQPPNATHEASVLCTHLARFVQEELDSYANFNRDFPPQSSRPQSTLLITDRSMDLMAPLVHEFTYQAMAHDLLPIDDREKVTFKLTINEGTREQEEKDVELQEKDSVWVDNRHRHMKDTIEKLMGDFRRFLEANPQFADENKDTTSVNTIKDMLAGLPQFQQLKEAYSLHINMAQQCMNIFQGNNLPDVASVEQTLATGLDDDRRKPKNILDQVVRLLDNEMVTPADRLRLIILYLMCRGGVIVDDVKRLLAHASLPPRDGEIVENLELLGARTTRELKDAPSPPQPLFARDTTSSIADDEYALSRFRPVLQSVLEELARGTLDQALFPYVRPPADPNEDIAANQVGSLRAGRPNWAAAGRRPVENRQRFFVFMAGGATYSESRACYDVSARQGKDIFLVTSHMITPQLFIRQVSDLSADKRRLDLPMDRPKPRAPAHIFEREPAAPAPSTLAPGMGADPSQGRGRGPRASPNQTQPFQPPAGSRDGGRAPPPRGGLPSRPVAAPTQALGAMTINSSGRGAPNPPSQTYQQERPTAPPAPKPAAETVNKPHKLEKKKRNFLGMKK